MDWSIVKDCVQRYTERVADYHLILSKIFKIHSDLTPRVDPTDDSPYEQQENNILLASRHQETCS